MYTDWRKGYLIGSQVRRKSVTWLTMWLGRKILFLRNTNISGPSSLISCPPLLWPRSPYPLSDSCGTSKSVAVQKYLDSQTKQKLHKRIKQGLSFCARPDDVVLFSQWLCNNLGECHATSNSTQDGDELSVSTTRHREQLQREKFPLQVWKTSQAQNLLVCT